MDNDLFTIFNYPDDNKKTVEEPFSAKIHIPDINFWVFPQVCAYLSIIKHKKAPRWRSLPQQQVMIATDLYSYLVPRTQTKFGISHQGCKTWHRNWDEILAIVSLLRLSVVCKYMVFLRSYSLQHISLIAKALILLITRQNLTPHRLPAVIILKDITVCDP